MARKNTSVLEDLMGISAHLPWKAGIVLAVIAYFVLHYFATKAPLTTNPAELKAMGKTLGDGMAQGIWTMLASVLQYVVFSYRVWCVIQTPERQKLIATS
jgi:restriction system protein